ncbi:MAG TPA: AAA family ATPase, partial [Acidimicrobiia bacterium]
GVTFLATDIDEDGGKIILTTGVPATQADDEGRMLRALRRIAESDPPFPLKIGANRGHVFAGEIGTEFRSTYTVMGDTVNLAARLMAAAPPGEVYAAPGVLDRSFTLFETKALPPFYVKGKTAPVQAYGVGPETGRRPAVSRGELPFTGRDSELGQVNTAIAALEQGTGSAITVLGETGYGKTRLVFEALAGVDQDEQLLIRAEPYGTDNPYWALRDPLRALLGIERADQQTMISRLASVVESLDPSLGPLVPLIGDVMQIEVPDTPDTAAIEPRFRPDRTAAAVVRLLEAMSPARLVVVVEDAHWLDQASTELVTMLGSVAAPLHPWLVIVTTRPGDGAPAELVGTVLELGPLPDEAVRRIAITMTEAAPLRPHDMDAVVERAAGNPLFLGEILRLVRETGSTEELPESLDAVVGSQIDTLPPLPRRLLRYSSVLGRSFRKVVLDELLRPEDVELDAASRRVLARFIEEDGAARYRFRHSVMHDVAYAGLSYRKRKELHGRAGEVIERLAGDDTDAVAEFLALHYAEAGDHEKAWRYGVVAGDRARVNFANIEASRHYRRALAAARSLQIDSEAELAIRRSLGDVLEQAALYREAVASYSRAVRLADDTVTAADLRLRSARARLRLGSYRSALGDIARATKAIKEDDHVSDVGALARLLSFRAVIYQSQQRPGDALRLATQAESLARETEEAVALARSLGVMDWAAWMLGRPEDATRSGEAIDIYLRTGHLDLAANLLNNTGGFAYFEGRWDDALDLYGRSRRAFEQAGNVAGAALADANIAEILINRGDPGGSEPLVQRAVRVLESTDSIDDLLFAEMQLARFLILDGDLSQAIERIDRLVDDAERAGRSGFATELTVLAAEAYNSTGDGPAALHALERIQESAQQSTAFFRSRIAVERSRALLSMDRIGDVLQEIEVGLSAADVNGLIYDRLLLLEERAAVGRRVTGSTDEALLVEVAGLRSKLGLNPATRPSLSLP